MIIDIVILVIAIAAGAGFAFAAAYLKNTPILVPVRYDDPVPVKTGAPIPFRFTTYGQITDKTVHRPRILLAMIVFSITVLILKPLVNASFGWNFITLSTFSILLIMFIVINFRSTLMLLIFAGILPLLLAIFGVDNYFWLIFSSGIIPGFKIGLDVSNSYTSLLNGLKEKMEAGANKYFGYYYTIVKWLPLLIAYQILCYFFPVIDVIFLIQMTADSFWKYPLIFIALILTLNLVWIVFPLFREALTTNNVDSAGEFTKQVRELEKVAEEKETTPRYLMAVDRQLRVPSISNFISYMRKSKEERPKNQDVNDYLDRDNAWLSFQSEQVTGLLFMTIFLLMHLFGQVTEAMYMANITDFTRTFEDNLITFWAIASTFSLWVSAVFLLGIFSNGPTKKETTNASLIDASSEVAGVAAMQEVDVPEEETASEGEEANATSTTTSSEEEQDLIPSFIEKNREIIQRAKKNSDIIVTCVHNGSDVLLKEEDPSVLEKDDPKSLEIIDIKTDDFSQKAWFKVAVFLLFFGGISLATGLVGHYSLGGSIKDYSKVEFAGAGAEVSLKIKSPFESVNGKWAAKKVIVSASSATPIFESYIADRIYTKNGVKHIKKYDPETKKWTFEMKGDAKTPFNTGLNADLSRPTAYVRTRIFDNRELIGKNIPLTVYLTLQYPARENGTIVIKSADVEQKIELRILTDNRWVIYEISRYLMATGILTLILFVLWLGLVRYMMKKNMI